jgi:hypothetical protein
MPNSFASTKCATNLAAAAKGIISDSDLQNLFKSIDARKTEGQADAIAKEATQRFVDQKQYQAFNEKRTAIFNTRAYKGRMEPTVQRWIKSGMAPHKALEAYTLGSSGDPGIGTRDNPATQRDHLQQRQKNVILATLKKEKLDSYVLDKNQAFDQPIREAWQMANTTDPRDKAALPMTEFRKLKPDQQTAVTRTAQLLDGQLGELRNMAAQEGTFIAKRDGYMGEQSHDRMKIRNASRAGKLTLTDRATEADRAAYVRDISRWMDYDGTRSNLVRTGRMGIFEDLDRDKFNNSLWDVFATGIRKDPHGGGLTGFGGNISAEAEKARILEFKDAASATAYNKKYGSGSLWQSHMDQVDHMAHTIITSRYLGPSAEANFQKLISKTGIGMRDKLAALRSGDAGLSPEDRTKEINRTLKQTDQLQNSHAQDYLDAYLGITKSPGNMTLARVTDNVMSIQRMGLLGSSIFSQLSALFPAFLQSRYAGVGMLQSAFGPLFTALQRMGKEDLQDFIRRQGVGMEGALGHLHSSLIGNDYNPGSLMKNMEAKFFKGVGLTKWNDVLAASHVMALSNEMAHNAGLKFDQLPFAIRRHLGDYNISPAEWDLIRKYAPAKFNDFDVLASDKLRSIPDAEMNAATGKSTAFAANGSRLDLEAKLGNLFQDSSDYARVQHDLKTSQLIPHGIRGTVGGDALRLTMQFATFNFAHGQRVLQRQWKSSSFPEFLFKTLGGLTMTGVMAYTLRQLAAGRNPMANDDLWSGADKVKQCEAWGKLLTAGAGQAGVGAMLGDLLFSQTYNNGRGDGLQSILGPTGDDAVQLSQFGHDAILKGKLDADQMMRFAQGHTPFANIWWIKPFVNYGLMYGLEEQMNPGVLKRMERASKQAGDPYWLPPSQNAVGQ